MSDVLEVLRAIPNEDVSHLPEVERYLPSMGQRGRPSKDVQTERERLLALGWVKRPLNADYVPVKQSKKASKSPVAKKAAKTVSKPAKVDPAPAPVEAVEEAENASEAVEKTEKVKPSRVEKAHIAGSGKPQARATDLTFSKNLRNFSEWYGEDSAQVARLLEIWEDVKSKRPGASVADLPGYNGALETQATNLARLAKMNAKGQASEGAVISAGKVLAGQALRDALEALIAIGDEA